jgi:hypothetical protein
MVVSDVLPEKILHPDPEGYQRTNNENQENYRQELALPGEKPSERKIYAVEGYETGQRVDGDLLKEINLLALPHDIGEEHLVEHVDPEGDVDKYLVPGLHLIFLEFSYKVTTPGSKKQVKTLQIDHDGPLSGHRRHFSVNIHRLHRGGFSKIPFVRSPGYSYV